MLIKYAFPIVYAIAYDYYWSHFVYLDFWPIAHIWLGWALMAKPPYAKKLAIIISVVEIVIIVSFFTWFFSDPEWSIWRTNWLINKIFVLLCFILLLGTIIRYPNCLRKCEP